MARKNAYLMFGLPPEDAAINVLRGDLAAAIARFISDGQLTQKRAQSLLGLPQGTVSNIINGNVEHLSIERLIRAMIRAQIPGWAEWRDAENARAGRGLYPVHRLDTAPHHLAIAALDPGQFYLSESELESSFVSAQHTAVGSKQLTDLTPAVQ